MSHNITESQRVISSYNKITFMELYDTKNRVGRTDIFLVKALSTSEMTYVDFLFLESDSCFY